MADYDASMEQLQKITRSIPDPRAEARLSPALLADVTRDYIEREGDNTSFATPTRA
jgi:hypothetical protein